MPSNNERRIDAIRENTQALRDLETMQWQLAEQAKHEAEAREAARVQAAEERAAEQAAAFQRAETERARREAEQRYQDVWVARFKTFIDEEIAADPSLADTPEVIDERWERRILEQETSLRLDFRAVQQRNEREFAAERAALRSRQADLRRAALKSAPGMTFLLPALLLALFFGVAVAQSTAAGVLGGLAWAAAGGYYMWVYRQARKAEPLVAAKKSTVNAHGRVLMKGLALGAPVATLGCYLDSMLPVHLVLFGITAAASGAVVAMGLMIGLDEETESLDAQIARLEKEHEQKRTAVSEDAWVRHHFLTTRPGESTWALTPFVGKPAQT